jgi:Zn-dependent peptidase ImmA (M78 family)/transcriptional regulator with XRE-family HTH domain
VDEVPITPSVLEWAIAESGLSMADVASDVGVTPKKLGDWLAGESRPDDAQLRTIARRLRRQRATFLLPRPPLEAPLRIQFRHPIGGRRGGSLSDTERRFIRRARRLQQIERWLAAELGRVSQPIPQTNATGSPSEAADVWRALFGPTLDTQLACRSASAALELWRRAIEASGIAVFQFAMGSQSCRGFCLWDDRAPVIAVNTFLTDEARAFTLFHELAHLTTRTDSACAAAPVTANSDSLERWCEAFAAAVLVPADSLAAADAASRVADVVPLARRYRVSLRAMTLRLIDLGKASWAVYDQIPGASDASRGERRDAEDDWCGARTTDLVVDAVQRGIIAASQALDYLDMRSADFQRLLLVPAVAG